MIEKRQADNVVSASDAKNKLGTLLAHVAETGEAVVIERQGKPRAAIISIEEYRQFRALQQEARRKEAGEALRRLRAEISARNKDMTEEEIEKFAQRFRDEVMESVVEKYGITTGGTADQ
jgi:prevent-host-death family protein